MSEIVELALITAFASVGSPVLLSLLNARQIAAKDRRDYARQDEVARRAAESAARTEVAAREASAHARDAASAIAENTALTKQIEVATNNMKDELIAATKVASHAEGVTDERARADRGQP